MPVELGGHFVDRSPSHYIATRSDIWRRHLPYVMVLGDSWFDYPGHNASFLSNPVNVLEAIALRQWQPVNWFDNAIVAARTSNVQRNIPLLGYFARGRIRLSAIVVSIGGNDYFENAEDLLLPYSGQSSAADCINIQGRHQPDRRINSFFQTLLAARNQYQPQAPILTHGYLPPVVKSTPFRLGGFRLRGPWIKPALEKRGYHGASEQLRRDIKIALHSHLASVIEAAIGQGQHAKDFFFSAPKSRIKLLEPEYWSDEIHLSPAGYQYYADEMMDAWESINIFPLGYT